MASPAKVSSPGAMFEDRDNKDRRQMRSPWAWSLSTLLTTLLGFAALSLMAQSFLMRQLDTKGCEMCYMRPAYMKLDDFDMKRTRFGSKYSMYIYREGGIDHDIRVKGVPVLFVPGNSGSSRQVRSLASEAAYYYLDVARHGPQAHRKRPLDFFTVDFNEDFTAFHGQTLLDQAEYLNDAIAYILSLYHTPDRNLRDSGLPDPTSVIVVGHSMGGVVARAMFTMPNYQSNSINTIVTLAAPHAVPAISFDGDIVRTYKSVNSYWRHAYSQKSAVDNPLSHVTLISIAGGGLDTIVPSDYASLTSLVPDTHGFTVFSSSIPNVWTGMDHLAITWCDQMRKSVVGALYDVIDASKNVQTVPREERMRAFRKWFLTGLEDIAEKDLPRIEANTVFTVDENSATFIQEEKLVLNNLGKPEETPIIYLLPVPSHGALDARKFTLLTNEKISNPGDSGKLDVLFCSIAPLQAEESTPSESIDTHDTRPKKTRLACKNAASDSITLPGSTRHSTFPFKKDQSTFAYLQYNLQDLEGYQFVAIVDKASESSNGWVAAEFNQPSSSLHHADLSLQHLLISGLKIALPAAHSLMTEIKVPALHSSLLAYKMRISGQTCSTGDLFAPLLRQYISEVYESKYFVNVQDANINLHGIAPYLPPSFFANQSSNGLSLQLWLDPTCNSSIELSLQVDALGSLGKLWMRYRIIFAAFPLLIVALVLRHQFQVYDETAVFISFAQGLNECLRGSIPFALTALTCLSVFLAGARYQSRMTANQGFLNIENGKTSDSFDYADNELLLGSDDVFFWFLVPLFGLMCVAVCVVVNYIMLTLTYSFALASSAFSSTRKQVDESKTSGPVTSVHRRIITTLILLSLVLTVVPYHFAYVVLLLVHLATCVHGLRGARESSQDIDYNFYNYAHSILILMMWILPINLPVLVVWIRNLALNWLTPFSSHHNILSIMPFILLVETLGTGRMVPRVQPRFSSFTNMFLLSIAAYAALYGVTYAYVLHHLANVLCAWLICVHFDIPSLSIEKIHRSLELTGTNIAIKKGS